MRPLIGSDGRSYAAPKTVLAEPYQGATAGQREPITLPAGTEVRQTETGARFGIMQARIEGEWIGVVAP